jgi:hypothetical protein
MVTMFARQPGQLDGAAQMGLVNLVQNVSSRLR